MSTPRDRDGSDEGSDWQEPAHLSGNEPADSGAGSDSGSGHASGTGPASGTGSASGTGPDSDIEPNFADRRLRPRDGDHTAEGATWRPPGWDLPAAERDVPTPAAGQEQRADVDPSWAPSGAQVPPDAPLPPPVEERPRRGLFGPRARGDVEKVFTYQGDVVGAQGWALQQGWTISDGNAPEDAVLRELVTSAPVRATKDHRPASVLRGRSGPLDLVAFDIVYASGRYLVPEYAVTAAPLLGTVPALRLSPARLWKHRTGGLVPIASGNEAFDTRWQLLVAEDGPQVRRLVQDPAVQGLLLGTDDGDEFWTSAAHTGNWAGGFLAAIRPDGHRPQLLEHHARLLNAIVSALYAGY